MRRTLALLLALSFHAISQGEDEDLASLLAELLLEKRTVCGYAAKGCKSCARRAVMASGELEGGPFWANRGKKDPTYVQSRLFADEPRWYVARKDAAGIAYDPFFITRGKKTVTEVKDYVTLGKIAKKI